MDTKLEALIPPLLNNKHSVWIANDRVRRLSLGEAIRNFGSSQGGLGFGSGRLLTTATVLAEADAGPSKPKRNQARKTDHVHTLALS